MSGNSTWIWFFRIFLGTNLERDWKAAKIISGVNNLRSLGFSHKKKMEPKYRKRKIQGFHSKYTDLYVSRLALSSNKKPQLKLMKLKGGMKYKLGEFIWKGNGFQNYILPKIPFDHMFTSCEFAILYSKTRRIMTFHFFLSWKQFNPNLMNK